MSAKKKKKKNRGWLANRSVNREDRPAVTPGKVVSATDKSFRSLVTQATEPVLVDFWAEWCGPCKQVGPVVEELARDWKGRARVVKVNVDKCPKVSEQFQIRSIPTLAVFSGGEVAETLVGVHPKKDISEALARAAG